MFILAIILVVISIIKLSIAFSNKDLDNAVDLVDTKHYSKNTIKGTVSWIFGLDGILGLICGIFILVVLW